METISAAIIDQTGFYIDAVMSVLEQQPDIEVVATATIYEDSYDGVKNAEIVVLQHETKQITRRLIQQVTTEAPELRLVILGVPDDERLIIDYIESGAIGYVRDTESFDQLMQVIRVVHNGGTIVHPEIVAPLCMRLAEVARHMRGVLPGEPGDFELTPRQEEVMALMIKGQSNQEIAEELSISVGTVKNHIHKIFSRMGVRSREQAVMLYSGSSGGSGSSAGVAK